MNNLENERKRLKTKYNVPEGQKLPLDKEARTNFNKEMNEWQVIIVKEDTQRSIMTLLIL